MAITITDLDVTENYSALTILKESQLNTAISSIESYCNTQLKLNLIQLALDTFPDASYVFNDDGVQTQASSLYELAALLADNETVTGNWTFSGDLVFSSTVTGAAVYTSTGQHRCRAYVPTANQTITTAIATALSFSAESYDVGLLHDNATNPDRITIPAGGSGTYQFLVQAIFAASAAGRRELWIYKNGAQVAEVKEFNPDAAEETALQCQYQDTAVAGDYYQAFVYQTSGGDLDVVKDVSWFAGMKIW